MIAADLSEPREIVKAISQSVECEYANLNLLHLSDYFFGGSIGTLQFSRKQAGEIMGDLDEAEDQLRDYYYNATRNYQVIEGIISPVAIARLPVREFGSSDIPSIRGMTSGGMYTYKVEINGYVHPGYYYPRVNESLWYAWLHRLAEAGIPTYFTTHWGATARLLVAIYKNEQKEEEDHSTLSRVIIPKINLREATPFVKSLVFLSNALKIGVGEDRATRIADAGFNSFKDILDSSVRELIAVDGIGKKTAERLIIALGGTP